MAAPQSPKSAPSVDEVAPVFRVYEVTEEGNQVVYYGEPRAAPDTVMKHVWPVFRQEGYDVTFSRRTGEYVLVAEPLDIAVAIDGIPWTNVILFVVTVFSTLYAGAIWYHVDIVNNPLGAIRAWPFVFAVLGVLGTHELGHYVMSRYHRVNATLPYFIPMPTLIGTMGAVIKMKGQMPNRKALFDIGVAGPLAGLVATVVVTAIGLHLPPVEASASIVNDPNAIEIQFGWPPLIEFIAWAVGKPLVYDENTFVNPVVIGGWVGMFVTFLNMLPVGQLDGGHIVRAMVGERQETVAAAVPLVLFSLAGYLFYFSDAGDAVSIWVFWGIFALFFAYVGPATPMDEGEMDAKRYIVGALTIVLGLLCFTPIPIAIG